MKRVGNGRRHRLRATAVALVVLVGLAFLSLGTSAAAPRESSVAEVIAQIAQIDQDLADSANDLAVKREYVNKTLVDVQNALHAQQVATAANAEARDRLAAIEQQTEAAQLEFDAFVREMTRSGNLSGSLSQYVAADDPDEVLEQMTAVEHVTREQKATIRNLQVARNQQANLVAATEASQRQADTAAGGAMARRDEALAAAEAARRATTDLQRSRADLARQRDVLVRKLQELRKTTSGPDAAAIDALPTPADLLELVPQTPVADPGLLQMAAEAAAKLALDSGQALLAAVIGEGQVPQSQLLDELGVGGARLADPIGMLMSIGNGSLGGGGGMVRPGLRGPEAVELVVNRAKSQLGVPYAWGGGDANGPTLGIRDGGVADAHGDYNKIGFDCSGLMIYAFAGVGIELPHYTGYQYNSGPRFPLSEMQRGDMIFYGDNASAHVSMYLGDGTMIEAPQSGDVVKISPVRTNGAMPEVVRLL